MNNLEWLMEHDMDAVRDALMCFVDGETIGCSECAYDKHRVDGVCMNSSEWLMAPHVDDESCRQDADQRECSETPLASKWRSNDAQSDSREKLEADVRKNYSYTVTTLMYPPSANKNTDMLKALPVDTVIGWLDRQAAIIERETEKKWSCFSDSAGGHITELTEQLESAHAKNRALKAHIAKMQEGRHGWHIKGKELQQQVDTMRDVIREFRDERDHYIELFHEQERRANELQSRDANLVREIGTLRAERDHYRELCGKLLDAADDMRRVRDAFDQFDRCEA